MQVSKYIYSLFNKIQ